MTDAIVPDVADPVELGLDPAAVAALLARAHREVDEGLLPSCQLALARHGRLALFATIGDAAPTSRYVIFSCTKALIATTMWQLLRSGEVALDDPAARYVPAFASNDKDTVTIEHLLVHTGGFPTAPMGSLEGADPDARMARYERWRLNFAAGSHFEYHPTAGHWVLADVIEAVTGTPYRDAVHGRVCDPLELPRLRLGEPIERQGDVNRLVAVGTVPTPEELEALIGVPLDLGDLVGEVTADALLSFNDPATRAVGVPGGGGIGGAADLALLYQGILHDPHDLWGPDRLAWATEVRCDLPDPIRGNPAHRSLGLMVAGDPPEAQLRGFGHGTSPTTFGHDGAGGQIAWCDPVSGISFAYLTNGLDQHVIREAKRKIGLSSRAAATVRGEG